jgi:RimJ/RimL family protein N-acetyltransferase
VRLQGAKVVLRPVAREDVPLLHEWEHNHAEWPLVSDTPHLPTHVDDVLKRFDEGEVWKSDRDNVSFAVEAGGQLVGYVTLWGIDTFNRRAHLGIGFGPAARGKGYGSDACRTLLQYAFSHLGLHRVQVEVLSDNLAAVRAYEAAGFVVEGVMRESAWVEGAFVDETYMSALATDASRTSAGS